MHAAPGPLRKLIDSIKIRALRLLAVCAPRVCRCCLPTKIWKPKLFALAINFHFSHSLRQAQIRHSHSHVKLMAVFGSCTAGSWVISCKSICQFVTRSAVFFFIFLFLRFHRLIRLAKRHIVATAATFSGKLTAWRWRRVRWTSIGSHNGGDFAIWIQN